MTVTVRWTRGAGHHADTSRLPAWRGAVPPFVRILRVTSGRGNSVHLSSRPPDNLAKSVIPAASGRQGYLCEYCESLRGALVEFTSPSATSPRFATEGLIGILRHACASSIANPAPESGSQYSHKWVTGHFCDLCESVSGAGMSFRLPSPPVLRPPVPGQQHPHAVDVLPRKWLAIFAQMPGEPPGQPVAGTATADFEDLTPSSLLGGSRS
jgi:hypothetical protein